MQSARGARIKPRDCGRFSSVPPKQLLKAVKFMSVPQPSTAATPACEAHHATSSDGQVLISRRALLTGAAVTAAGAAAAACTTVEENQSAAQPEEGPRIGAQTVPFDGAHQAGIQTKPQAHCELVGINLRAGVDRAAAIRLMRLWTEDARALCSGENPAGSLEPEMATTPAILTITCGVGERFFDIVGAQDQRPAWLHDLPAFDKDRLNPAYGQTDIILQICGDDPLTVAFASRHMLRAGVSYATAAWVQQGFLNANGTIGEEETPRNLFGQKDGTINPRGDEEYSQQVWIEESDTQLSWLHGGTAMVLRRIAMNLDTWEILDRHAREVSVGRTLDTGAPLGGQDEFDTADFDARDQYGLPVIDPRSHMALAAPPSDLPNQRLLRRAYNYFLPPDPTSDQLSNAGLLFACFQKNPDEAFVPIQQRLNDSDRLNKWITHVGSSVYAIFPGVSADTYWGQELLA